MKPKSTKKSINLSINAKTKSFLLTAVAVSLTVWDLSFNLGAFGEVFFGQIFTAWVTSSATFLGCLLLPKNQSPVDRKGLIIMAVPTFTLILTFLINVYANPLLRLLRIAIAMFSYVVSLPYSIYIVFSLSHEDIVKLSRQMTIKLVTIAALMGIIGYSLGRHNYLLLSCYDFKVSGNDLPTNCRSTPIFKRPLDQIEPPRRRNQK